MYPTTIQEQIPSINDTDPTSCLHIDTSDPVPNSTVFLMTLSQPVHNLWGNLSVNRTCVIGPGIYCERPLYVYIVSDKVGQVIGQMPCQPLCELPSPCILNDDCTFSCQCLGNTCSALVILQMTKSPNGLIFCDLALNTGRWK